MTKNWSVTTTLPSLVQPKEVANEMSNLADVLEEALHRYDPPRRVDAFDLLIERLTSERERLYNHMMSDVDEDVAQRLTSQAA